MLVAVAGLLTLRRRRPRSRSSVQSRTLQPGELVVLSIATAGAVDRVRVRAFDRDVPAFRVDDRAWRALVGIDLDVRPGTYPVTVDAGPRARLRTIWSSSRARSGRGA